MKEMTIYRCSICGNLVCMIEDSGVTPNCCGTEMEKLIPNTIDGAMEKHVPVVKQIGKTVKVSIGETPHPMQDSHYIQWIALLTEHDLCIHMLEVGHCPETEFRTCEDEKAISAYAYCNLHGLWKLDLHD